MRASAIGVALALAGLGTGFGEVHAICPYPVPKVCSRFFESDVVFVGTVLSHGFIGDYDYIRHRMKVTRVFRGEVGPIAIVYSPLGSASLQYADGEEHVVFARRGEHDRLTIFDTCGPLDESATVADTIREIESLSLGTDATIEGEVLKSPPDGPGIPGVKVEVWSATARFETRTDSKGRFSLRVPPGIYEVSLGPSYEPSDYGWRDLRDLQLAAGQCAQLQLISRDFRSRSGGAGSSRDP